MNLSLTDFFQISWSQIDVCNLGFTSTLENKLAANTLHPVFQMQMKPCFYITLLKKCRHCPKKKAHLFKSTVGLEVSYHIMSKKYYMMEKGKNKMQSLLSDLLFNPILGHTTTLQMLRRLYLLFLSCVLIFKFGCQ